jgi:hypothetical protein
MVLNVRSASSSSGDEGGGDEPVSSMIPSMSSSSSAMATPPYAASWPASYPTASDRGQKRKGKALWRRANCKGVRPGNRVKSFRLAGLEDTGTSPQRESSHTHNTHDYHSSTGLYATADSKMFPKLSSSNVIEKASANHGGVAMLRLSEVEVV